MPNKYCPILKRKIEELKEETQRLEALLLDYRATGKEKTAQEMEEILPEIEGKIKGKIEELKSEYLEKVKSLLGEWYPKKDNLAQFLQSLQFNEKGKADIEKLDVSFCGLTSLYLPKIIEGVKELYCNNNFLESLPDLPETLTRLGCSVNQLTFLPKLPETLTVLSCDGNQLTSLPKLPETLTMLLCVRNQLTSLPDLPETLTRLECHRNQLTSLPDLPESLQYLDCRYNPLTPEAIKKIKAHKNAKNFHYPLAQPKSKN